MSSISNTPECYIPTREKPPRNLQMAGPLVNKDKHPLQGQLGSVFQTNDQRIIVKCSKAPNTQCEKILKNEIVKGRLLTRRRVPHSVKYLFFEVVPLKSEKSSRGKDHCKHEYRSYQSNGGTDLFATLENIGRPLEIESIESIAKQLFEYLRAIGEDRLVHRDFKATNIGLQSGHISVFDLGLMEKAPVISQYLLGTIGYLSPESLLMQEVNPSTDIWSLGCILFELATNSRLLEIDEEDSEHRMRVTFALFHTILERLGLKDRPLEEFMPKKMLQSLKNFKLVVLTKQQHYQLRPKKTLDLNFYVRELSQIRKRKMTDDSKKLALLIDLLSKMLRIDPEKRISPTTALKHPFFKARFSDMGFQPIVQGETKGFWLSVTSGRKTMNAPLSEVESCIHFPIEKGQKDFTVKISYKSNRVTRNVKVERIPVKSHITYVINANQLLKKMEPLDSTEEKTSLYQSLKEIFSF